MPLTLCERYGLEHPEIARRYGWRPLTREMIAENRELVIERVRAAGPVMEAEIASELNGISADQTNPPTGLSLAVCFYGCSNAVQSLIQRRPAYGSIAACGTCSSYYAVTFAHDWWSDFTTRHFPFGTSWPGFLTQAFCRAHACQHFDEPSEFDFFDQ